MELVVLLWSLMVMGFFVPFVKSIVSMGALLLGSALVCTVVIGWSMGSWYGFILFLVYITGLLVLFGYMLAMSPNEKFSDVGHVSLSVLGFVGGVTLLSWFSYELIVSMAAESDFQRVVIGMYANYNVLLYWFFGVVLFMALVMVVTLCFKSPKPLRGFLG